MFYWIFLTGLGVASMVMVAWGIHTAVTGGERLPIGMKRPRIYLILCAVFLVPTALAAYWDVALIVGEPIPDGYLRADGIVASAGPDSVGSIRFWDISGAEWEFYPLFEFGEEGDPVAVYYDPEDPFNTARTPQQHGDTIRFASLLTAAFATTAAWLFWRYWHPPWDWGSPKRNLP